MTPIALLLALAAAPDAGAAPSWRVSYDTSKGSDSGNGRISATAQVSTEVTPRGVTRSTLAMKKGKRFGTAEAPRPLAAEVREAIAALLPKLPVGDASYSTNPNVDDEGWDDAKLVITREGKTVTFQLVQGVQVPAIPPEVQELLKLVAKAQRPTE